MFEASDQSLFASTALVRIRCSEPDCVEPDCVESGSRDRTNRAGACVRATYHRLFSLVPFSFVVFLFSRLKASTASELSFVAALLYQDTASDN